MPVPTPAMHASKSVQGNLEASSRNACMCALCRKRRKVQPEKPAKRVRLPEVDNDQTRKLRSALPSEEPSLHIVPSVPSMQHANGFNHNAMQASNSAAAPEEAELDSDEEQEMDSQSQGGNPCSCQTS